MIGIDLIIHTSNIDDLSFLCGPQTKNIKKTQVEAPIVQNSKTSLLDGILSYGRLSNYHSHIMGIYMLQWL